MVDGLVVADTDLVIDFLRGRGPGAPAVREWLTSGRLRLTALTAFELRVGTSFLKQAERIAQLLRGRTYPLDALAALRAGEIFARLTSEGAEIGVKDCMVAGTCLRFELPLASRNVRHFERIPGLDLVPVT